jgi:hypothetical protein
VSFCALPRAKVNEQTAECGLNYIIKIKSGILRSVLSISTHDLWPDFWVTDSLRLRTHCLKEDWIPISKVSAALLKVYLKIATLLLPQRNSRSIPAL